MSTLFIIGNGFDLHHGLKTSYADFAGWLKKQDFSTYTSLGEIYGDATHPCWSDFEDALGRPNVTKFEEMYRKHDPMFLEFEFVDDAIENFTVWVKQLSWDCDPDTSLASLFASGNNIFLSFNYTHTLEDVYRIKDDAVCHIHGSIIEDKYWSMNRIVVGHAESAKAPRVSNARCNEKLAALFEKTKKNTAELVKNKLVPLISQKRYEITEIVVMGLSVSDADNPYFKYIISNLKVDWVFYCRNEDEKRSKLEFGKKYLAPNGISFSFKEW